MAVRGEFRPRFVPAKYIFQIYDAPMATKSPDRGAGLAMPGVFDLVPGS